MYSSCYKGKMEKYTGRIIYSGTVTGEILKTDEPISFFGSIDPKTGIVKEQSHPLFGLTISGKILVFPYAKGSTVGSYILFSLKKYNKAPLAIILSECETIVAVGAIISEIPTIDQIAIENFKTGDKVTLKGEEIILEK